MFKIIWTNKSLTDIEDIFDYLKFKVSLDSATKIIDEIYAAPQNIRFVKQYQIDDFREDCRRIIVRNFKILFFYDDEVIYIVRVFNTYQNPSKSLL